MNIKRNINSLFNEVLNASVSSVKETSHVPANKSAVHKPASRAKKAPEKARKHNSKKTVPVATGRMLWLKILTREALHDGVLNPGVKRKMYVEVKQQYYGADRMMLDVNSAAAVNNRSSYIFKRNVINIYFDRSKEELDRLAAVYGHREFGWFTRKPDIAITDIALGYEHNTVMLKNPSDFYEYANWAIKHADYVKNNWR